MIIIWGIRSRETRGGIPQIYDAVGNPDGLQLELRPSFVILCNLA